MISVLLVWSLIICLLLISGLFIKRVFEKILCINEELSFLLIIFSGLAFITTLLQYFSLIISINIYVLLSLSLISIIYVMIDIQYIRNHINIFIDQINKIDPLLKGIFIFCIFAFAFRSTFDTTACDTRMYHMQAVKWITEFPAIPGLGNINSRLAYNSSWFTFNALFDFSGRAAFFGGGLFLLLTFLLPLSGANEYLKKNYSLFTFIKIFLFFLILMMPARNVPSLLQDGPNFLIIFYIILIFMESCYKKTGQSVLTSVILYTVGLYLVTLKLSNLFIILLPLFIYIKCFIENPKYRKKMTGLFFGLSFLIITPWLIRFVILSGYLVYPIYYIDIFNFDWKMPIKEIIAEKIHLTTYTKINNIPMPEEPLAWIPIWFKDRLDKGMFLFFMYSLIIFIVSLIYRFNETREFIKRNKILFIFILINFSFWFFTAPRFRYAYGFIGFFILMLISFQELHQRSISVILINVLLAFALLYFRPESFVIMILIIGISIFPIIFEKFKNIEVTKLNKIYRITFISILFIYLLLWTITELPHKAQRKIISDLRCDNKAAEQLINFAVYKILFIPKRENPQLAEVPVPPYNIIVHTQDENHKLPNSWVWDMEIPVYLANDIHLLETRGKTLADGFRKIQKKNDFLNKTNY